MSRVGVFICHCGENIARTVDINKAVEEASKLWGITIALDYKYMCSEPGQALIKNAIKEKGLKGVVVAACSPHMHEKTFRRAALEAGLNPFLAEMANIREHCSWVHPNKEEATQKAIDLIRFMVEKVRWNQPLSPITVPVKPRVLVIGGGIAGIQAALDIAQGGKEVILVEKEPSIGGHMAQLSETFPTLDCSQCILTPKMVEVRANPNIRLYTYSEVEDVSGYIGNFKVKICKKSRSVIEELCTGCGACIEKCPQKKISSEFDRGLGLRTAIFVPFPQAVPNIPVIDREHCLMFLKGRCSLCQKACTVKAIDYDLQDTFVEEEVGAIIVATGFDLYSIAKTDGNSPYQGYGEYGYGRYKDVIDGLRFERMASASGPTGGRILRPSDGREPKSVVFIQCVGSRHDEKGLSFCSKICCMYTAKHAMLYKHKVHDGQAYVFYMDIRAGGKNYEEFVRRSIEEEGALYLRGRVSKIYQEGDKLIVLGADTLSGAKVEIAADMVVLATAILPQPGIDKLAQKLGISYDKYHFLSEAHPKLRPVETNTAGVFLAGVCQAPKDIPDTVAQASAAASKVLALFSQDQLEREPLVASVNEATCTACFMCQKACTYKAIERKEIKDRSGRIIKVVARVNPGLCTGCGVCSALCPSNTMELQGFADEQVYAQLSAI